jgi:hypothetical protein
MAKKDWFKIQSPADCRIETTGEGLCCVDSGNGTRTVLWSSIIEIAGFKRDRVTTDLICLAIKFWDKAERVVEINEDMDGFDRAIAALGQEGYLKADWREFVTLPSFDTRRFILWASSKSY